jgi:hypothetical protein
MNPGIQMLELAIGIKDVLVNAGFTTIESLLRTSPTEIATMLGIEFYVGKIIIEAARRAAAQSEGGAQINDIESSAMLALPAD